MMVYQPAIDITWKTVAKVVPQYANVTAIVYFAVASNPSSSPKVFLSPCDQSCILSVLNRVGRGDTSTVKNKIQTASEFLSCSPFSVLFSKFFFSDKAGQSSNFCHG
jgi:hypothetical protein